MATRQTQQPLTPLRYLPYTVLDNIARSVDQRSALGNNYMTLGEMLGYTVDECFTLQLRCQNPDFNYSPTFALMMDYGQHRNGTVEQLQRALVIMHHPAQSVIPQYLHELSLHNRHTRRPGVENSEGSLCPCPGCLSSTYPVFQIPQTRHPSLQSQLPPFYHPQSTQHNTDQGKGVSDREAHRPETTEQQNMPSAQQQYSNMRPRRTEEKAMSTNAQNKETHSANNPLSMASRRLQSYERHNAESTETTPKEIQQGPLNVTDSGQIRPQNRPPVVGRSTHSLVNAEQPSPTVQYCAQSQAVPPRLHPSNVFSNDCEKCRLSDPDETQVLTTTTSPPRTGCTMHSDIHDCSQQLNQLNMNVEHRENRSSTCVRNVNFSTSSGSGTDSNSSPKYRVNKNIEQKRIICEKSNSDNIHELGEQTDSCSMCRQRQQLSSQKRNTWPSDEDKVSIAYLRQSSASSDGSMFEPGRRHSTTGNDIEEIYSRLSFNATSSNSSNQHVDGVVCNLDTDKIMEEMCDLNQRNDSDWKEGQGKTKKNGQKKKGSNHGFNLVTFSYNPNEDDDLHLREIIQLCTELKAAGLRVKIDMDPDTFDALRLNKQDWLDRMTTEAKYVIVCLSPAYHRDTQNFQQSNQPRPDDVQLNARYIFNTLRKEYHNNGCLNKRMIPVMFTNSGVTLDHIPQCMGSTFVYKYPEGVGDIIKAAKGERSETFHVPY